MRKMKFISLVSALISAAVLFASCYSETVTTVTDVNYPTFVPAKETSEAATPAVSEAPSSVPSSVPSSESTEYAPASEPPSTPVPSKTSDLTFRENGQFRILMFGSLNAGVSEDPSVSDVIRKYVDAESPDLVIFNGNFNDGTVRTADDLSGCISWVTEYLAEKKIPWCTTFGVNTENGGISRKEQMAVFEKADYCLSSSGPLTALGVSNFSLPVKKNGSDKTGYVIYCLDSNGTLNDFREGLEKKVLLKRQFGGKTDLLGVNTSQILWYWDSSLDYQAHNGGQSVPGILCFQVPSYTFSTIYTNPEQTGMTGTCVNKKTMPELDSGIVWTAFERGDIRGLFAAYDNQNDYCGRYLNMYLGVTPTVREEGAEHRGARIIDLSEDGQCETRIVYLKDIG